MIGNGRHDGWHSYKKEPTSLHDIPLIPNKHKYDWDVSETWSVVSSHYEFFCNENYSDGVYILYPEDNLSDFIQENEISAGDLMYFEWKDIFHNEPSHATMISKVDNDMIYYTGHTDPRFNAELTVFFESNNAYRVHIIKMKEVIIQ